MPLYRRRLSNQIAKVNARSIDGYFGAGTPCFFIRGTILSDAQVDGEYRTLSIQRPGNIIEVEEFNGDWATLVITTRSGNRLGDNLVARMMLRDVDLRTVGIDCERIMAGLGTFETPLEEPVAPPAVAFVSDPVPRPVPVASNVASNGFRKPTLDFDHHPEPEPEPAPPESGPEPDVATIVPTDGVFVPAPEVLIIPSGDEPAAPTQVLIDRIAATEPSRNGTLFGGRTTIADGRVLVEVGASVVAIGLPVVLFFLRSLFKKKG